MKQIILIFALTFFFSCNSEKVIISENRDIDSRWNSVSMNAGNGIKSQEGQGGASAINLHQFLNSMGAVSSVAGRGETIEETIENLNYTGLRWLRVGYEDNVPVEDFIEVHNQTGVLYSYGMLSGHSDIDRLLRDAKQLAFAGALLALEGSNEPNNWGITYQGEFGGRDKSWLPVAKMHRDLYVAAKNDSILKNYPVWSLSENGAQVDNVGLQFLTIPDNVETQMPAGTQYADYANCHNYVSHPSWLGLHDNQTWLSANPTEDCPVDGLYGNYGKTWFKKYPGYTTEELKNLPRVTTETGIAINDEVGITEEIQARLYLNLYLSQFKQGWKHTAIYLLKGRANEPAHEKFAFFTLDNKPKKAAQYLHNFTSILTDDKPVGKLQKLNYSISDQPSTIHDLLLQKSNGNFMLLLWGERFKSGGTDDITVNLGGKCKKINIYDPTMGTDPVKKLTNRKSVKLSLSIHPVIVEIEN